jgi:hypothetical protein
MSRKAVIIPLDDFKAICKKIIEKDDFPYEISAQVTKDLSKINFDFENYELGDANPYGYEETGYCSYPVGYKVLSNGLPVLFVNAGGDWEYPICFILYWDGKQIRAYIPENGNVFNKKERCAYGSEEDDPEEDHDDLPEGDPVLIEQDIIKRILV